MTLHRNVLGVDVATDWIDVFDPSNDRSVRIATSDLRSFARKLSGVFVVRAAHAAELAKREGG